MNCFNETNADLLIGYFENTLPETDRRAVDAHASECPSCREMLGVHRTLDAYTAPEVSSNFDKQLYARIAADRARPWGFLSSLHVSNWKLAIPVTAVAAMLAVGVVVFRDQAPLVDEGTKSAEAVEIHQLEQALDDLELLMPL